MDFRIDAQALLDTAATALPEIKRRFIAPGPAFAKICQGLVVHPDLIAVVQAQPTPTPNPGSCAVQMVPGWRVVYIEDCYPQLQGRGTDLHLPDSDAMTDWTLVYVNRVQRLMNAILDFGLAAAGTPDTRDCSGVTVGAASYVGPFSGVAYVTIPVVIGDDGIPLS